ncbi:MAG: UDP-N-acetylmuramoyl-L-alanine--D-glutamate ligase [Cyclobacteriaceae bacterium]
MKERIVILGAGESGTGAAVLAAAKGYEVFVSDMGVIKPQYKTELEKANINFEEGSHTWERISGAKLVIKSPGIPDKSETVKRLRAEGTEVIDEIEFGFRYTQGKVIAITGTNGKTTTTLLTYHLLKSAGYHVALAGNVGESFARKIAEGKHDWYVIEVSSFQLDGTTTFKPQIGVLLNITPDHLDRYEFQLQNYVNSKFRLTQNMNGTNEFIYYADDEIVSREVSIRNLKTRATGVSLQKGNIHAVGGVMHFQFDKISFEINQADTTLRGPHNLINTMAAVTAAHFAGVAIPDIRSALKTFKNAAHRLESIATINGVEFVNDSKATNVDSVVYALGSYEQPLIWIAGGIDKGNDYRPIKDAVARKVKTLICLGKDNQKLNAFFKGVVKEIKETQNVKELVRMALAVASKGDVVLLSPACASFDLFKNYEDRGNQFRNAVLELKKEIENPIAS